MRVTCRAMPPRMVTAPPDSPVPAPRSTTGMRCLAATLITAETSAVFAGRTTASGTAPSIDASRSKMRRSLLESMTCSRPTARRTSSRTAFSSGMLVAHSGRSSHLHRPRRPGAVSPHGIQGFRGDPERGTEACLAGPGACSLPPRPRRGDPSRNALLAAPPAPWLRPSRPRICVGTPERATRPAGPRVRGCARRLRSGVSSLPAAREPQPPPPPR